MSFARFWIAGILLAMVSFLCVGCPGVADGTGMEDSADGDGDGDAKDAVDGDAKDVVDDELDDAASFLSCDPLEEVPLDLELEEIMGIGKSDDGTIYVIDFSETESTDRLFVLEDGKLQYKTSGSDGGGGEFTFNYRAGEETRVVGILIDDDESVQMAVADGHYELFDELTENGEVLALLDEDDIQGIPVTEIKDDVRIDFWGTTADGERVLQITMNYKHSKSREYILYMGPPDAMKEYKLEYHSDWTGGTEWMFERDGEEWILLREWEEVPLTEDSSMDRLGVDFTIAYEWALYNFESYEDSLELTPDDSFSVDDTSDEPIDVSDFTFLCQNK